MKKNMIASIIWLIIGIIYIVIGLSIMFHSILENKIQNHIFQWSYGTTITLLQNGQPVKVVDSGIAFDAIMKIPQNK